MNRNQQELYHRFLTAVQAGDFEKAGTYVATGNDSGVFDFAGMEEAKDVPETAALIKGISNNYKFSKPEEKIIDDNNAEVTVEVTSIDFAVAMETAMKDIMDIALELAMEDLTEEEQNKSMEEKSIEILTEVMTSKDAEMVTRDVTLTVTKDDEGKFKIVPDDQLMEAIIGNAAGFEEMIGGF